MPSERCDLIAQVDIDDTSIKIGYLQGPSSGPVAVPSHVADIDNVGRGEWSGTLTVRSDLTFRSCSFRHLRIRVHPGVPKEPAIMVSFVDSVVDQFFSDDACCLVLVGSKIGRANGGARTLSLSENSELRGGRQEPLVVGGIAAPFEQSILDGIRISHDADSAAHLAELDHIGPMRRFEPDLMNIDVGSSSNGVLYFERLAAVLRESRSSGRLYSRVGFKWHQLRRQHASRWSLSRLAFNLYALVGYGYRPLQAFGTYVGLTAASALLTAWLDGQIAISSGEFRDFGELFLTYLTQAPALLGGDTPEILEQVPDWLLGALRSVLAVSLAAMILAFRRFMRIELDE